MCLRLFIFFIFVAHFLLIFLSCRLPAVLFSVCSIENHGCGQKSFAEANINQPGGNLPPFSRPLPTTDRWHDPRGFMMKAKAWKT
jgi:hypothetical protein